MALNSYYFNDGLGDTTGDELVTTKPWNLNGIVYYVSSVIGDDTNAGTERLQPMATTQVAVTAANDGDIIVLAADHDETVTATIGISDEICIVGAGSSSGSPTASLTFNMSSGSGFQVGGANNVEFRNILFPTRGQANTDSLINLGFEGGGDRCLVKDCRFEASSTDTGAALAVLNSTGTVVQGCTFIVTATTGDPPATAMIVSVTETGFELIDCTFDGGTVGYADGIALTNGTTMLLANLQRLTLLRGADASITAASTGRITMSTGTGSGRLIFT